MEAEGSDTRSLVSQQVDLDVQFIQRNIRDLSITAQFSQLEELQELQKMAYTNLKNHLAPGGMLAADPALSLEAYRTLSGVVMALVETKRKATDTLLKARTLIDIPRDRPKSIIEEDGLLEGDASEVSISEGGVFQDLVDAEPDVNM